MCVFPSSGKFIFLNVSFENYSGVDLQGRFHKYPLLDVELWLEDQTFIWCTFIPGARRLNKLQELLRLNIN